MGKQAVLSLGHFEVEGQGQPTVAMRTTSSSLPSMGHVGRSLPVCEIVSAACSTGFSRTVSFLLLCFFAAASKSHHPAIFHLYSSLIRPFRSVVNGGGRVWKLGPDACKKSRQAFWSASLMNQVCRDSSLAIKFINKSAPVQKFTT